MLDAAGKPTPRLRASVLREELEGRLQRLEELKRWTQGIPEEDERGQLRVDQVAAAIEHVRLAMDALELAGQD